MYSKPLIFDFMEYRQVESVPAVYAYDYQEQLNLVQAEGRKIPFIDMDLNSVELLTKTKVKQEGDEDRATMEMVTKTRVRSESDDHHNPLQLELSTKTFIKVESDDEKNNDYY